MKKIATASQESSFTPHNMTKMALCIAFCCVSAFISFPLPFTPGLVTALTVALSVTAFLLPPKLTFITIAAYVIFGAAGLPVFPGGMGGMGRIFGPTGGFYLGYPFVCLIESYLAHQGKLSFKRCALVAIFAGVPLTYVGGVISIMLVMEVGLWEGLMMGALPFVIGDVLKALLAAFIAVRINKSIHNLT